MLFLSLTWRNVFLLTTKAWQTGKLIDFCKIDGKLRHKNAMRNSNGLETQYAPRKVRALPRQAFPSDILFVVSHNICY